MHESIILVLPTTTGIAHNSAVLLHVYCATYDPPTTPPCVCHTLYSIGNAISCKGQPQTLHAHVQHGRRGLHGWLIGRREGLRLEAFCVRQARVLVAAVATRRLAQGPGGWGRRVYLWV